MVSEPQSQGKEINQEENGSVRRKRRISPQRSRFCQSPTGTRVAESIRYTRFSVPTPRNERLTIYEEHTASYCHSVNSNLERPTLTEHSNTLKGQNRSGPLTWSKRINYYVASIKARCCGLQQKNHVLNATKCWRLFKYCFNRIVFKIKKQKTNKNLVRLNQRLNILMVCLCLLN